MSGCAVSPERNNFCAPSTLSPEMAVTVNANTPPLWQAVPQNLNEWHNLADNFAKAGAANAFALAKKYNVDISEGKVAGVRTFTLIPAKIDSEKKDKVILYIKDNGIGIKNGEITRVFERGFTGENGRRIGQKSTGIGLYLCKKLCDKLCLSIELNSKKDEGTEVRIIFPKNSYTNLK